MKFEELFQQSNTLLEIVEKINEQIAKTIVKTLKDIIPDLEYSIGWTEAGINTICFYSDSYDAISVVRRDNHDYALLGDIIEKTFPNFSGPLRIECPSGIYLPGDKAQSVRERLKKLKDMTL